MNINFYVFDSGRVGYATTAKQAFDRLAGSNDRGTFSIIDERNPNFSIINRLPANPTYPSLVLGIAENGVINPIAEFTGNTINIGEVVSVYTDLVRQINNPTTPTTGGDTPPPVVQSGFGNIGLVLGGLAVAYFLFNR